MFCWLQDYVDFEIFIFVNDFVLFVEGVDEFSCCKWNFCMLLLFVVLIVVIIFGIFFYFSGGCYQEIDNGYFQLGLILVSVNVSGFVIVIVVKNNDCVKIGQVFFCFDFVLYQVVVDEVVVVFVDVWVQVGLLCVNYCQGEVLLEVGCVKFVYVICEVVCQKVLLVEGILLQN